MGRALTLAKKAGDRGEVPIGAVITHGGLFIAGCGNRSHKIGDPTQHAESRVLRKAAKVLGRWRLTDVTLYSTVEPCVMCAAACFLFRTQRIVYGCPEPKFGGIVSRADIAHWGLNHKPVIKGGVRAPEASDLMKKFFQARRIR